jgi:hypothetical protein
MFKKIKEFFVGKPATERHPLDAVTTPKIPEPVTETVVVMEPPKEQMIPIPYVPEAAPAVTTLLYVPPAVVEAAPAKKPRKPRAPKEVAEVKEKAPAKAKKVVATPTKSRAKKS